MYKVHLVVERMVVLSLPGLVILVCIYCLLNVQGTSGGGMNGRKLALSRS